MKSAMSNWLAWRNSAQTVAWLSDVPPTDNSSQRPEQNCPCFAVSGCAKFRRLAGA